MSTSSSKATRKLPSSVEGGKRAADSLSSGGSKADEDLRLSPNFAHSKGAWCFLWKMRIEPGVGCVEVLQKYLKFSVIYLFWLTEKNPFTWGFRPVGLWDFVGSGRKQKSCPPSSTTGVAPSSLPLSLSQSSSSPFSDSGRAIPTMGGSFSFPARGFCKTNIVQ